MAVRGDDAAGPSRSGEVGVYSWNLTYLAKYQVDSRGFQTRGPAGCNPALRIEPRFGPRCLGRRPPGVS